MRSKAETLQAGPGQSGGLPEGGERFPSIIGKGYCHAAPHLFQNGFRICLPTDSRLPKQVYVKTESPLPSWKRELVTPAANTRWAAKHTRWQQNMGILSREVSPPAGAWSLQPASLQGASARDREELETKSQGSPSFMSAEAVKEEGPLLAVQIPTVDLTTQSHFGPRHWVAS